VSRPDLAWLQDQLAANGLKFDAIRGDSFACQCPVHHGDGKSARFSLRNGVLLFTCYAYGCDFRDVKERLDLTDLTDGDVYDEHIMRARKREIASHPQQVSDAQAFVIVAENDIAQGKKLSEKDIAKYRKALIQAHKGVSY